LHARRRKRISFARASPGRNTRRRTPTQVAERRGGEWDAFVDLQSAFAHSGNCAGLYLRLLRNNDAGQLKRRDDRTYE
jgi:hypothetical protein